MEQRRYGIYLGIVDDDCDPEGLMRVRIRVPSLDPTSAWALPCLTPGTTAVPKVGAQVWVIFEAGDIRRPVWLGTLEPDGFATRL